MAYEPRIWAKYVFKDKNRRIVHKGITTDLDRREGEHQRKWSGGRITQVGNRTTKDAARKWEKEQGCT